MFYKNEVCPIFYEAIGPGGIISLQDLQDYVPKIREPLKVRYRGCDIFMNPSPSMGGELIKGGLKYLSKIKNVSKKDLENALYKICKNFKPKNKNLKYLITDTNGKILKNSFDLNILLKSTNWKKLQK